MMQRKTKSWDPDWQKKYEDMIATPEEAVSRIRPGQRVFIGTGCAQPQELVQALTARGRELADTEIVHLLTMGDAPYADQGAGAECFRVNSFFIAENVRGIIQEGLGDYTPDLPLRHSAPVHVRPAAARRGPDPGDARPTSTGMCSLGISVDIVKSAAENASLVIAQVNPRCRARWATASSTSTISTCWSPSTRP